MCSLFGLGLWLTWEALEESPDDLERKQGYDEDRSNTAEVVLVDS